MRGGVVLHLLAGGKGVLTGALRWRPQTGLSDPAGKRAVGDGAPLLLGEQLLCAHHVAARTLEGGLEQGQRLRIARRRRAGVALGGTQDAAYRITRQLE